MQHMKKYIERQKERDIYGAVDLYNRWRKPINRVIVDNANLAGKMIAWGGLNAIYKYYTQDPAHPITMEAELTADYLRVLARQWLISRRSVGNLPYKPTATARKVLEFAIKTGRKIKSTPKEMRKIYDKIYHHKRLKDILNIITHDTPNYIHDITSLNYYDRNIANRKRINNH